MLAAKLASFPEQQVC